MVFGDKLAANSIAVAEGLAACDDAATVSGVVLDLRDAEGLDVDFDTAIACWATSTSPSPLTVVHVTVTLTYGLDEGVAMRRALVADLMEDAHFPQAAASWAVGYSWQYATISNDSG